MEPACSDAVRALFVFLNLLERKAERVAQLLLTHSKHKAAHSDARTYMPVDGVGGFFHQYRACLSANSISRRARRAGSGLSSVPYNPGLALKDGTAIL
jgi:hypothetical protein